MKRTSFRRAALLACVALTAGMTLASCEKENYGGTIRLNAEKLSGDGKTYVEGVNMGWVNGDVIRFNGTECTVTDGVATGIPTDVPLIAFYPRNISNETNAAATSANVTVPSEYTYSYSDEHQILALPMVGKAAAEDETITMKHLCSAMQITINNGFGEGLVLDSIILRRSGLSGSTTVDLSGSDPVPGAGDVDSVRMAFSGTTIAANSGSLTVQIPVLPVAEGTATRVSVRGHLATSGTAYRYSRSTSIALGRAMVHAAPVTMTNPAQGNHMEEIVVSSAPEGAINGLFSVSDTKQVYFSKGNLQYNKTSSEFSFMEYQWSTEETNYQDIGEDYAEQNIVSLFGWGAWRTGNNPWNTSDGESDYSSWGRSEPIADWRTLTQAEWDYLLNPNIRTTPSRVLYAKATVNGVNGLIILPDDWSTTYYTLNSTNTANANYGTNPITSVDWTNNLEAHGAVFLPAAGYRAFSEVSNVGSCGTYWSSTPEEDDDYGAYDMFFGGNSLNAENYDERYNGMSVRLVQDAN